MYTKHSLLRIQTKYDENSRISGQSWQMGEETVTVIGIGGPQTSSAAGLVGSNEPSNGVCSQEKQKIVIWRR